MTKSNPTIGVGNDTIIDILLELSSKEVELINSIRNRWRFGEMTIMVRDGQPFRMVRTTEFIDLDKK